MALVYVMLLFGAALASCGPIDSASYTLSKVHRAIVKPLSLDQPEVGSRPLFSSVIKALNGSCQTDVVLMNATLDVYMRVFGSLLHHGSSSLPEPVSPDVRDALGKLRKHMHQLKNRLNHLQQDKDDVLSRLYAIKEDDPLVQRKVLAELPEVHHAAVCVLSPRDCDYTH